MAEKILLKNVTLAFPAIAEPQSFGEGEPAYGAKFPITPDSKYQQLLEAAIVAVAEEQWKNKAASTLEMLKEDGKVCFVKKVYRSKSTGEPYQGFEGKHYLSTRNAKTQPTVFTRFGEPITEKREIERLAFSGAVVHASLEIWAQDNKWGKRINCTLRGVVVTGEGENFGGGSSPASKDELADVFDEAPDASDLV